MRLIEAVLIDTNFERADLTNQDEDLGNHEQQAAQVLAAREVMLQDSWMRRNCGAGQRAVRGRRGETISSLKLPRAANCE
jgi:hypothetical protein